MEFQHGQDLFRITSRSNILPGHWIRVSKVSSTSLAKYLIDKADRNPNFEQYLKTFCPEEDNNIQGNPYPYTDSAADYAALLSAILAGLDVYFSNSSSRNSYIPGTQLDDNSYTPPWESSGGGVFFANQSNSQNTIDSDIDEDDPVQQHMATMRRISSHNVTSKPHKLNALNGSNRITLERVKNVGAASVNPPLPPRNEHGGFVDPSSKDKIHDSTRKPKITKSGKAVPYGGSESDALTIRNKKNVNSDGYLVKGTKKLKYDQDGFPVFNSKYDTVLDDSHLGTQNEYAHFQAANDSLARQLAENPRLADEMGLSSQQVKFLQKIPPEGIAPPGLTWHHHQDLGRMQLVDESEHKTFRHTGGMSIWGGGYK